MNPTAIMIGVGVFIGALIWLVQSSPGTSAGSGSPFLIDNAMRYWQDGMKGKLLAMLSASKVTAHPDVDRAWIVGKAGAAALDLVREIQGKGNLAITTVNFLDERAPVRLIGSVLPTEVDILIKGRDVAILPKL